MSAIFGGAPRGLVFVDRWDRGEWVPVDHAPTPLIALSRAWIRLKLRTFRVREGAAVLATVINGQLAEDI